MMNMPGNQPTCQEKNPCQIEWYRIECESPPCKIYRVKSEVDAS